jgi:monomeric isocitrate dehydrogenase
MNWIIGEVTFTSPCIGRRLWLLKQKTLRFSSVSPACKTLSENEDGIVDELNAAQGNGLDLGGYYHPDETKVTAAMRPSATLNAAISAFSG